MAKASDLLTSLVTRSGVVVTAESNITPEVVLFDAASTEPSVFDLLGIRPHVLVKTPDGRVIAEYGAAEPKNYVLAGVYLVALIVVATVAGGAIIKALKAL